LPYEVVEPQRKLVAELVVVVLLLDA